MIARAFGNGKGLVLSFFFLPLWPVKKDGL